MWRRMYIYTEEREKGVWRKTQKHLQPEQDCLLVLGENRKMVCWWILTQKTKSIVFYPIQEITLGNFLRKPESVFEEKQMEIHLLIIRTVDSISMKESSIEMIWRCCSWSKWRDKIFFTQKTLKQMSEVIKRTFL